MNKKWKIESGGLYIEDSQWPIELRTIRKFSETIKNIYSLSQNDIDQIINDLEAEFNQQSLPGLQRTSVNPGYSIRTSNPIPNAPQAIGIISGRSFNYNPQPINPIPSKIVKICECGAEKTYGPDASGHSSWCQKFSKF